MDVPEVIICQLFNLSLPKGERKETRCDSKFQREQISSCQLCVYEKKTKKSDRCGQWLTVPCLQVHDVTFGFDPHVPHVVFGEQQ